MNGDEYHDSGEFLDLLSLDAWQALRDPVRSALAGAAPQAGPIVDLGAGSGLGTLLIAEVLPAARILAVEPSAVQRAACSADSAPSPSCGSGSRWWPPQRRTSPCRTGSAARSR